MPLAEVQSAVRQAIFTRDAGPLAPLLVGGRRPLARFDVHQRHYAASLARAMTSKFPAVQWLIGGPAFAAAVDAFVHERPPRAPCIAEYGAAFPEHLDERLGETLPYLADFARLERAVAAVSIEIDLPAVPVAALAECPPERLGEARLRLQPGLAWLAAGHGIDRLLQAFLGNDAPEAFALEAEHIHLEVRGARGRFSFRRLGPADWTFRRAVGGGAALAEAAEAAAPLAADFDPSRAIAALFAEGLVTGIGHPPEPAA